MKDKRVKRKTKEKETKNKKKKKTIFTLLMLLVCVYASVTLVKQQIFLSKLREQKVAKAAEIQIVAEENKRLEELIKNIGTAEYIEQKAREQLGLVKPGERIFVDSNNKEENKSE